MENKLTDNGQSRSRATGPRTPEGKRRSSLNALRHGLTAQVHLIPGEDPAAYQAFEKNFLDEYQPHGPTEQQLVVQLALTAWRLNRIPALEQNELALGFLRHAHQFETEHPDAHAALAVAAALNDKTLARTLANLSIQDQRLTRKFFQTLAQLHEIQRQRLFHQSMRMGDAVKLHNLHKEKGIPYNPFDDGFVFSNDAIETHIRREQRLTEAARADFTRRNGHHNPSPQSPVPSP